MLRRFGPVNWLLIAVAGWAVLCAMVALAGFGGSYRLLADDPTLAPPLPKVPPINARTPLGPIELYAEASNRPLFYPDRKPIAVHVPGQNAATAQALDVVLTSVLVTPPMRMAIVQDPKSKESLRVREGQALGGNYSSWKLVSLKSREAVFNGGSQGQTTLDLRVFNGQGGEEPTQMGLTPQVISSITTATQGTPRNGDQPPPVDAPQNQGALDAMNAAANDAADNAGKLAAQQAEQIRRRIEERRQQAQAQGGSTPPTNEKVQ